ncbi:tetratricopeptide repeat protein [Microtetraspora malaysiensis]|uniref:tetratricopeptide repeat protein n=1 Tax=Microtetraspora malaysiensis TaxID=161358 RepID=UPI003D8A51D9
MTDNPSGRVEAQAHDGARQYNLGQGVMHIGAERPQVALFTVAPPPDMVGRHDEISDLVTGVRAAREAGRPLLVSAVHGMAGVGKTALARAVAARVASEFPDARLEIDLYGFTPGEQPRDPAEVLGEWLSLAGFEASDIPKGLRGREQAWRAWLARRRVLLLLDNARTVGQVLPLLPGSSALGCLAMVTSRNSLDGLDAQMRLRLDTLPLADAIRLLEDRSGHRALNSSDLMELAQLCGRLPLALRPIGSLLAEMDAADLISLMRDAESRLMELPDMERPVRAAFAVSYEALSEEEKFTLRCCAWHPGPDFDAFSVTALNGIEISKVRARLTRLSRASMLNKLPHGRLTFHDLFLGCARRQAADQDSPETIRAGTERLYGALAADVDMASDVLTKDLRSVGAAATGQRVFDSPVQARLWLTSATPELRTAAEAALTAGAESALSLGHAVASWLRFDDRANQAQTLYALMRAVTARSGDRLGQAEAMEGLGEVAWMRDEYGEAVEAYQQARALYEEIGDRLGEAHAMEGLGEVARMRGEYGEAVEAYRKAQAVYEEIGSRLGQANAMIGLGEIARVRDEYQEAVEAYQQARALYEEIGSRLGQARAVKGLGDVARVRDEYQEAVEAYQQARALYEEIGDRLGEAHAVKGLGEVARARGEYREAVEAYRKARALYEEIGDRLSQAHVVIGLGEVARMRGEYGEAVEAYQQARALYEEIGSRLGQAHAMIGLGEVARARGEYREAVEAYRKAQAVYEEIGNRLGQANAMKGLGEVARARDEYQEAVEAYQQARALYEEIGNRLGQANAMIGLGEVARMRGEYGEAVEAYQQARALYEEIGDRLGQANVALSFARMAEWQGNLATACAAYADAENVYTTIGLTFWANHCADARTQLRCVD